MADLFTTKYPNNIRNVIAGDPISQSVFRDDVVLQCDTAGAGLPFTINLLSIPNDFWSTQYKLYIVDIGNNAASRTITINAAVGEKINGASSITINTNGGGVLIRILDNGEYIATYNSGNTSSDCCTIVQLTNAALLALIAAGTVSPLTTYQVTDPTYADGGVFLKGIINNTNPTLYGSGLFYDADYQGVGNYSSVSGYAGNIGIWYSAYVGLVAIGNVVIYNNLMYVNLTGSYGSAPDGDAVNWQLLPKTETTGYIKTIDFVKYNVSQGEVIYRADKRENEVDLTIDSKGANSLLLFQWGRSEVKANKILAGGILNAVNSGATFTANMINTGAKLTDFTPSRGQGGTFIGNILTQGAEIYVTQNFGTISYNNVSGLLSAINTGDVATNCAVSMNNLTEDSTIELGNVGSNSRVYYNTLIGKSTITAAGVTSGTIYRSFLSNQGQFQFGIVSSTINGCEASDSNVVTLSGTIVTAYLDKKVRKGYSNWEASLDLSKASVYLGTTVTIDALLSFVGIFILQNALGGTVTQIVNAPTNHSFTFRPDSADTFKIQSTSVGASVATDIIANSYTNCPIAVTVTGRTNGCDEVVLNAYGNLVGITQLNTWN